MKNWLNIALPKGRLGEKAYNILEEIGYECPQIRDDSRRLIFENPEKGVRYFWVKPSDVTIYVERGSADLGIVGSDILQEYRPDVYELVDLGIGRCRMMTAGPQDFVQDPAFRLRVATKFPHTAARYFAGIGRDIDIIRLNGSIELAPLLGLSDIIVDIVETGRTLKENGLITYETISDVSARLIANRVSYKFAYEEVNRIVQAAQQLCGQKETGR